MMIYHRMAGNLDEPEARAFLNEKGAIGLLVSIDEDEGTTFGDISNQVAVTEATLTTRIETALELELLDQSYNPDDHGNAKRYTLTNSGLLLQKALEHLDADSYHQEYVEAKQELEDRRGMIDEWLEDHENQKNHFRFGESMLRGGSDEEFLELLEKELAPYNYKDPRLFDDDE